MKRMIATTKTRTRYSMGTNKEGEHFPNSLSRLVGLTAHCFVST